MKTHVKSSLQATISIPQIVVADQGKYTRVPESNDTTRAAMDYFSNLARI